MGGFRKRPVVVEAEQWSGSNWHQMLAFAGKENVSTDGKALFVHTLEGVMVAPPGWWVIRGWKGEFYACAPDVFEATYEPLPDGEA